MIIILMGVSGCGKTTVGKALAGELGWPFLDADDYHSGENIRKMSAGIPLDDADRQPWLERLRDLIATKENAVLACSAMKASYRNILASGVRDIRWVHLHGTMEEVLHLMAKRKDHFMKEGLLRSQFETLELPANALTLPVTAEVQVQTKAIRSRLGLL